MKLPLFGGNSVELLRQIQAWTLRANELDPPKEAKQDDKDTLTRGR